MSEKLHLKQEKHEALRNNELDKHHEALKNSLEKKARSSRHEHAENLEKIRSKIDKEAKNKHEHDTRKQEKEKPEKDQPVLVNRELKDMAYRRTLRRTQSKLSAPSRVFSKIIHQPAVEAVSEVAGKTIARPSGILVGGITAFLGSSLFLWIARHYGYEYNFLLFACFFVGGFFIGLFVELGLYMANRKSR